MNVPALASALKSILTRADVGNPAGDAAEILCAVLNCPRAQLILQDDEVSGDAAEEALAMARRRAGGEPIQYVIGSWSFMGRDYKVGRGVLIPRDDTEVVVREALRHTAGISRPAIVDLCAGSGVIAVTLAKELPGATVYAVEKSETAFAYLTDNITLHQAKVQAICSDLKDCADGFDDRSLDLIVSNPPYIRRGELSSLQREVQYEPRMALDGGESGYDFYQIILALWTKKLKDGGKVAFEIGEGQYRSVADMLTRAGFTDISGAPDIQGITRAVTATRSTSGNG